MRDGTPPRTRDLTIPTLTVWALIIVVATFVGGPYALLAAFIGCALVFAVAAILARVEIKVLIVVALGVVGGLAFVWWGAQPRESECGISCGTASTVENAPSGS